MTRTTRSVTRGSSAATWAMLLGGPIIWYVYFWIVYLVAEGACSLGGFDFQIMGLTGLSFVTIVITVVASLLTIVSGLRSYSVWRKQSVDGDHTGLAVSGLVLSAIFLLSVLATGLPALVIQPC